MMAGKNEIPSFGIAKLKLSYEIIAQNLKNILIKNNISFLMKEIKNKTILYLK